MTHRHMAGGLCGWPASNPVHFTRAKRVYGTQWLRIGGWIDRRILLNIAVESKKRGEDSVGICYGLDGRSSILSRGRNISVLHSVQTGSGTHAASYTMGIMGSFEGGKAVAA
jgi:hypothetical protein